MGSVIFVRLTRQRAAVTPTPCPFAAVDKASVVHSRGTVERFAEALRRVRHPGDYVIVVRGIPRSIVMSCPDGCGEALTLNLDKRSGRAWVVYGDPNQLSVYPSVWREGGCGSHFILWSGQVLWCMADTYVQPSIDRKVLEAVRDHLSLEHYAGYEAIADDAHLSPWEVLWGCEELVREGLAKRGPKFTFKGQLKKSKQRPRKT